MIRSGCHTRSLAFQVLQSLNASCSFSKLFKTENIGDQLMLATHDFPFHEIVHTKIDLPQGELHLLPYLIVP